MERTITERNEIRDFFNNEVSKRKFDYNFIIEPIDPRCIHKEHNDNIFKVCNDLIQGNRLLIFNTAGPGEDSKIPIDLKDIKNIETTNWADNDHNRRSTINLKTGLIFSLSDMSVKKLK